MTVVDCPKCDGNGSYYFAGGNLDCSWCRGTGKMEDKDAQDYTDNRNKAYNNASDLIHNTDGFIDGSDVPTSGIYESKASEDVTFAGRGDIVTYEDLWGMLDFGSRLSIAYGHIMNQTSDDDFAMFIINSEPEQLSDNHRDWIKSAIDNKGGIDQVKQSMGIESKASLKAMKDLGAGDFAGDIPDDMDLDEWLGESKANELDLKNYTINPFDDVWVSECKRCGAEFTEYDYDNSENSVRDHLMSEHGIDDSHLGNTLYNQNEALRDDHNLQASRMSAHTMSPELVTWLNDAGLYDRWYNSMTENARIDVLNQYKNGVNPEDYNEYSYESKASEDFVTYDIDGNVITRKEEPDGTFEDMMARSDDPEKTLNAWNTIVRILEEEEQKKSTESKASEHGRYYTELDAEAEDIIDQWVSQYKNAFNSDGDPNAEDIPSDVWDRLEKTDGGERMNTDDVQRYMDENIDFSSFESKETEHDDLSSGHQISDRYSNTYILFLQRWKQEHPDWKQNVDKTLSNFVKYMVKMGYNKRSAEMAWNDYLYSPESKATEGKWNDLTPDMKLQVAMHHNLGGGDSGVKFEDLSEEDKDEYVLKLIYAQTMGKSLWGVESKASEYSIKEEFDLQDQDGKYEMLSKADLSVTDATNYSTYSHSELPEEVKDSLKGDEDSYGESWSRKSSINKIEALERLGIKQGDAIQLSGLEFEDYAEDLQGALKGEEWTDEDARTQMKDQVDYLNNSSKSFGKGTMGYDWQEGEEVENPNSEFQQYYPDYNNIGESQTSRTKYECEYCDHGFKSNEALSIHYNDKHAIAPESLDGYANEADHSNCPRGSVFPMDDDDGVFGSVCTNCGQNFDRDGEPCEDCVVARDNESKASETISDYEREQRRLNYEEELTEEEKSTQASYFNKLHNDSLDRKNKQFMEDEQVFGEPEEMYGMLGMESIANEIEAGDVYRMFNYNDGNPICNLCGVNVKDNEDIWEDHLVDTHGYKIESNMRDRDVDIDYIDGSDVPTSGIYESKANEGYVTFDKNGVTVERHDEEWEAEVQADSIGGYVQKEETSGGDLGGIIYDARESKASEALDRFEKDNIIDDSPMEEQLYDLFDEEGGDGRNEWPQIRKDFCGGNTDIDSLVSGVSNQRSARGIKSVLRWADKIFKSNESKANEFGDYEVKCDACDGKGYELELSGSNQEYFEDQCDACGGKGTNTWTSKVGKSDESKASEAGLEDHSCPECGFITSDNSDYVDHLNAHEE